MATPIPGKTCLDWHTITARSPRGHVEVHLHGEAARLALAQQAMRAEGLTAEVRAFDACDAPAVAAAVADIEASLGAIDVRVDNAGITRRGAFHEPAAVPPEDDWNWFDPEVVGWNSRMGLSREFLCDLQELRRAVEPAGVPLAAQRATAAGIAAIESTYAGMKAAVEHGGDYASNDLRFHQGLLRACHKRMVVQMSKALGALPRTSFEIGTRRPDGAAQSLPLHRAVLDAVIARDPDQAGHACLVLIDGAQDDIEQVLASRRKLPSLAAPAARLAPRGVKD